MSKEFDYEQYVLECYENNLDKDIHNASEENALLLFKTLLNKAIRDKQDVRIISQELLARFYNQLADQVKIILNNGNTVRVIVEKEINDKENHLFYKSIAIGDVLFAKPKFEELPNFIVIGNNAYRYEKNKKSYKAIANFNNQSMGDFMRDMFDNIFKDIQAVPSTPITP